MPSMQELVEAVKRHALLHYEEGGWDNVVEAWTDEEIREQLEAMGPPAPTADWELTVAEAIAEFARIMQDLKDYGDDIRASAGKDTSAEDAEHDAKLAWVQGGGNLGEG